MSGPDGFAADGLIEPVVLPAQLRMRIPLGCSDFRRLDPSRRMRVAGRDGDLMIECPSWAAKKVNGQAQRGGMSKEVSVMDRWEQSPTYAASQD